jgi:LCP family protein required for cell wall assembly
MHPTDTPDRTAHLGTAPGPDGVPDPATQWGPVVAAGGPRTRRWPRRLVLLLVVLLAIPVGWGVAVAAHASSSMEREQVTGLSERTGSRVNVLITGSDSRADLSEEERHELKAGSAEGERTDTIMVLSVQGSTSQLLAFPRDLWVQRCDGTTGRINASLAHGGMGCLVDTVEALSGIPIHHTMSVDFGGFRDLVDAVGGVELCTEKDLVDPKAGLDLPAGCHVMDGRTALGFVRTRQLDSDLFRIQRQQQFISALVASILTRDVLLNPVTTWEVAGAGGATLTADEGLGPVDMARIAWGGRSLAGGLDAETVPATPTTINGAAVLEPDMVAAEVLFAPLRADAAAPDDPGSGADDAGDPPAREEVRVAVLNGARINGLAGRVGDALAVLGYDVPVVTDGPVAETTRVVHAPGERAAAERVAADLATVVDLVEDSAVGDVELPADADVAVLLGAEIEVVADS